MSAIVYGALEKTAAMLAACDGLIRCHTDTVGGLLARDVIDAREANELITQGRELAEAVDRYRHAWADLQKVLPTVATTATPVIGHRRVEAALGSRTSEGVPV